MFRLLQSLVDRPFLALEAVLGIHHDLVKLLACFLLSYPLASIMKRLPERPALRSFYSLVCGLVYLLFIFHLEKGVVALFIDIFFTYYVSKYVRSPKMPWIVFFFDLGHTLLNHIDRYLYPSVGVDITATQMVLCMKLTAFAWSVSDGRRPKEDLTPYQTQRVIYKHPPMLHFLGFSFFFPSLLAGPAFDYSTYKSFITLEMFEKPKHPNSPRIPENWGPALVRCIIGLIWLTIFVIGSEKFPLNSLLTPKFYDVSMAKRFGYSSLVAILARAKYYGAWEMTDGACVLSGIGYNGKDSHNVPRWDRVKNIDPMGFEFAPNIRAALEAWNMNTNKWLKNSVYLRVPMKNGRPTFKNTFFAFLTSAVWHGVYPGYYLTFLTAAFIQYIARYIRRYIRPFFLQPDMKTPGPFKWFYDIVGIVTVNLTMSYLVISFLLLDLKRSLFVWGKLYFAVHLYIILAMVLINSPVRGFLARKVKERSALASQKKL
ncbi:membrane bound O-acyltransferase [Schizosaccharomyces japonicus yFS275]|uniref:Membrane bound O-acyltransferase n=1 Tax=Schizosaccharomyces japonicus (strain yFS275 / FY16936) TaxID=402676 RepID=B6K7S6_SCHJY|nr:membrane bound O-acyltransferase [Schizosaccharomyces japonicus yFS275]EEB09580.1 membrane bound O-acyltransferase [Schizosaccharomyces japonicus yFS275]